MAGASLTQAWVPGVQGDGPGTEGSISASSGRALRLGMAGTWRPARMQVSVQRVLGLVLPPGRGYSLHPCSLRPEEGLVIDATFPDSRTKGRVSQGHRTHERR